MSKRKLLENEGKILYSLRGGKYDKKRKISVKWFTFEVKICIIFHIISKMRCVDAYLGEAHDGRKNSKAVCL